MTRFTTDGSATKAHRAENPAHKTVEVDVCEGWPFKGATIRGQ